MELARSTSRGGFSVRGILTFVLAVLTTVLLWTILTGSPAHAAEAATWKGDSILYGGDQYFSGGKAEPGQSHGLADGTSYYLYVETVSEQPKVRKAHVIYFAPGTSPPTATSAAYVVYDYSDLDVFSNPQNQTTLDMVPRGEEDALSSCEVEGGMGWVICPLTVTLASGMDWLYNQISQFIAVPPTPVNDTNSDLYVVWNVMRSFANVAFIVVFLIIIYSQLTNAGVSNYGLKKLLPRLIVAALLVNLSFLISAVAVDLSNILGYSLQDLLIQLRGDTFSIDNSTYSEETNTWASVTGAVLSGGAAAAGLATLLAATGGSIAGMIFLLLPLLLGLVLTALFVLLILAARQAIIVILIVIAPIAFVAYLLPNTEKWFDKWRELFMTMLIFFPALSLVFGGSQLAGGIIIQNAYGAGSFIMMIFGMAVQVAPLVITPLLLKLSGGLLGRIAGLVNDPRKGLMDRTRNWANSHAEDRKFNKIGNKNMSKFDVLGRAGRSMEYRKRRLEKSTERGKVGFERYANRQDYMSRRGQQLAVDTALDKMEAEEVQHDFDQAVQELRAGDASGLTRLREQADYTSLERIRARTSGRSLESIRQTGLSRDRRFGNYATQAAHRAAELDQHSRIIANATEAAKNMQAQRYAEAIEASEALQVRAGGVDPKGAQRALATAFAAQSKAHSEAIANATSILSHYNLDDKIVTNIALGSTRGHNVRITDDIREAAIAQIAGGGNTDEIIRLMEELEINTSAENQDFRQTFHDKLIANSGKPKFAGAGILAAMKQGQAPATGEGRLNRYIVDTVNDNKIASAELLVTQDKSYLWRIHKAMRENNPAETGADFDNAAMMKILQSIKQAKSEPDFSGRIGERAKAIDAMQTELLNRFGLASLDDVQDP